MKIGIFVSLAGLFVICAMGCVHFGKSDAPEIFGTSPRTEFVAVIQDKKSDVSPIRLKFYQGTPCRYPAKASGGSPADRTNGQQDPNEGICNYGAYPSEDAGSFRIGCGIGPTQYRGEIENGEATLSPEVIGQLLQQCEGNFAPVEFEQGRISRRVYPIALTSDTKNSRYLGAAGLVLRGEHSVINNPKSYLKISSTVENRATAINDTAKNALVAKQQGIQQEMEKGYEKSGYPMVEYLWTPCQEAQGYTMSTQTPMSLAWFPKKGKVLVEEAGVQVLALANQSPIELVIGSPVDMTEGMGEISDLVPISPCWAVLRLKTKEQLHSINPPGREIRIGDQLLKFKVKATGEIKSLPFRKLNRITDIMIKVPILELDGRIGLSLSK